jgi:hypothetical protein
MQVTFVEALDQLMPGFDPEISKLAQRVLVNPRNIDYHTGVFASKVTISCNLLILSLLVDYLDMLLSSCFLIDYACKGWKTCLD